MKYLYVPLFIVLLMSCNSTKKVVNQGDNYPKPIKFSVLAQGSLHGDGVEGIEQGGYVFVDKDGWQKFLEKLDKVNDETGKYEALKTVDLDKNMVIGVFSRVLGAGGSKIAVEKIIDTGEEIHVSVQRISKGGLAIMVMNQPFQFVSIPKTGKKIVFEPFK